MVLMSMPINIPTNEPIYLPVPLNIMIESVIKMIDAIKPIWFFIASPFKPSLTTYGRYHQVIPPVISFSICIYYFYGFGTPAAFIIDVKPV